MADETGNEEAIDGAVSAAQPSAQNDENSGPTVDDEDSIPMAELAEDNDADGAPETSPVDDSVPLNEPSDEGAKGSMSADAVTAEVTDADTDSTPQDLSATPNIDESDVVGDQSQVTDDEIAAGEAENAEDAVETEENAELKVTGAFPSDLDLSTYIEVREAESSPMPASELEDLEEETVFDLMPSELGGWK